MAALGGLVAGLALAAPAGRETPVGLGVFCALAAALVLSRPRNRRAGSKPWLVLVGAVALLGGLTIGSARLAAIDAGSLAAGPGTRLEVRGTVISPPRTSGDLTRFTLEAAEGRITVEAPGPGPGSPTVGIHPDSDAFPTLGGIDEGRVVEVSGSVREPAPWERAQLERTGASRVLVAESVRATPSARGGLRSAR